MSDELSRLARVVSELRAQRERVRFRLVGREYEEQLFYEALADAIMAGAPIEVSPYLDAGTVLVVKTDSLDLWGPGQEARRRIYCASFEIREALLAALEAGTRS